MLYDAGSKRERAVASVKYTRHAKWRMRQRGIPEEAVEAVLEEHHTSYLATRRSDEPQTAIFVGEYQGRNLRVYVERDTTPIKVKTAVWEGVR
jgi:hypothetical protein